MKTCDFICPVEATIKLIGGKYKAVILWHLMSGTLRYNELHKCMPKATDKNTAVTRIGERRIDKPYCLSGCTAQNRVFLD